MKYLFEEADYLNEASHAEIIARFDKLQPDKLWEYDGEKIGFVSDGGIWIVDADLDETGRFTVDPFKEYGISYETFRAMMEVNGR